MADFDPTTTGTAPEEKDAYDEFLDSLEGNEQEQAEREDRKAAEDKALSRKEFQEWRNEQKVDSLLAEFKKNAGDDAVKLYDIYSHGVDMSDPKQVKRLMDLAIANASSVSANTSIDEAEMEQEVERRAAEKAASDYGTGPISGGSPAGEETPQEYFDRIRKEAVEKRDTRALGRLLVDLPPDAS